MTDLPTKLFYSFGAFRVDPHERLLYKADREIPLTPMFAVYRASRGD